MSSTEIGTVPVVGELTGEESTADIVTFKPKTKAVFGTFEFAGSKCASAGLNAITGKVATKLPNGQEEQAAQPFQPIATEASGELKVASSAATLKGSSLLKLATGRSWGGLADGKYETESSVKGKGSSTFEMEEGVSVTCNNSQFIESGLGAGLHETLSLTPSFEECTGKEVPERKEALFNGVAVKFTVSPKCGLKYNAPVQVRAGVWEASVDLTDATCVITFTVEPGLFIKCEVTIKGELKKVGWVRLEGLAVGPPMKATVILSIVVPYTSAGCLGVIPAAGGKLTFNHKIVYEGAIAIK